MSKDDMIVVEGERELFLKMQKSLDGTLKAAKEGLQSAALNIIADAKENLRNNKSIATDQLRASGKVQKVDGSEDEVDAGFFSQKSTGGYAWYVEYGTKASSKRRISFMYPLIKEWLRKKTSQNKDFAAEAEKAEKSTRSLLSQKAYFIALSIIKKGTKAHPFLTPAVEKNKQAVSDAISMAIQSEIK